MDLFQFCVFLTLAPVAIYALAILLRIACFYRGVEIPALGRAVFTALTTSFLSLLVCMLSQIAFVGIDRNRGDMVAQFMALFVGLSAHVLITTGLYVPLLGVRFGVAFSIWLAQAAAFVVLALLLGSCLVMPLILFG